MRSLIDRLAAARIGQTHNFYRDGAGAALRRDRLAAYLEARAGAPLLLVGEAPGYRGARVSGIPFTSERQLTGAGPAEATATIVHRVLAELGLTDEVLLWNVVPTHPGTPPRTGAPTPREVARGSRSPRSSPGAACARGRAGRGGALGVEYVRHPSHGGARAIPGGALLPFATGGRRSFACSCESP